MPAPKAGPQGFGHCWAIATHKWEMTPEEMKQGQAEWLKSMKR